MRLQNCDRKCYGGRRSRAMTKCKNFLASANILKLIELNHGSGGPYLLKIARNVGGRLDLEGRFAILALGSDEC
jgi:hypothetical protein